MTSRSIQRTRIERRKWRTPEEMIRDLEAEIAKVKEESRGLVITLQGAVLFKTGRSELLPAAGGA